MKTFMGKNFLLSTETAKILYHTYAAELPIIDYHCHVSPRTLPKTSSTAISPNCGWGATITSGVPSVPPVCRKSISQATLPTTKSSRHMHP